jgi:hypothetical protein
VLTANNDAGVPPDTGNTPARVKQVSKQVD